MTCMRAHRSSKFGQIPLLTAELAALERLKKWCCHCFSAILDQILFKFSYLQVTMTYIYKSLDEFEIQPDPIRDHRVSCS